VSASRCFLLAIYSIFAVQVMGAIMVIWSRTTIIDLDGTILLMADWTAFLLMAHRHARQGNFHFSRPAQLLAAILIPLSFLRLFLSGNGMATGLIFGSYLGLAGCYLLFSRLRDLPGYLPEALVASFVLIRLPFVAGFLDDLLGVTHATVEIGSWFLYLLGHETLVSGNTIVTKMGAVSLFYPCTGLMTGGGLLAIASALAFSRPWSREAKIGLFAAALLLSFLAGCIRVVVLNYAVSSIEAFQFWHGVPGFMIFAAVTYALFGAAVFAASKTSFGDEAMASVPPAPTPCPPLPRILAPVMAAAAVAGWIHLPWALPKERDFPYPDLTAALPVQNPRLAPNPDPYAQSSWGQALFADLPQGRLTLGFRPGQDFNGIAQIFRNPHNNTPTKWETVAVPEGSVAWRVEDGSLELATLVHPTGRLTATEAQYNEEYFKPKATPWKLALWLVGQQRIRDMRSVLIHLTVPGADGSQVQTFVPVVVQAAKLTAKRF